MINEIREESFNFIVNSKMIDVGRESLKLSKKNVENMNSDEKSEIKRRVKEYIVENSRYIDIFNDLDSFINALSREREALKMHSSTVRLISLLTEKMLIIFGVRYESTEASTRKSIKNIRPLDIFLYDEQTRNDLLELLNTDIIINKKGDDVIANPIVLKLLLKFKKLKRESKDIYHVFTKTMPNGKVRELAEPNEEIMEDLKAMNCLLQGAYDEENEGIQIAYKKGKSVVDNALPHKDNKFMFKADIKNFFPSCKRPLVKKYIKFLFIKSFNWEMLLDEFLNFMLIDDALCLGNPISATVANAIVAKPCAYMNNMFKKAGMAFTQYSDDITVSSDKFIKKEFVVDVFNKAYTYYELSDYFKINLTKLYGLSGSRRNTCGVAYDHTRDNKLVTRRRIYRNVRVAVHKLSIGEQVNMDVLKGQIAFMVMMGEEERVKHYLSKFGDLNDQYNLCK